MVLYLELQSDLKGLVGVLQGFKGHVRVAKEPRKVHWYHWRRTKIKVMANVYLKKSWKCYKNESCPITTLLRRLAPNYNSLTLRASVPSPSEVTVAAWASTVVIAETEAVRWAHSIIAGQVVHTRHLTFPGGHGWSGSGGGQSDAKVDQKRKKDKDV